jgi:hypothetical protein
MAAKESLSLKIQTKLKGVGLGSEDPIFITWCDAVAEAIHEEYSQANTTVRVQGESGEQTGYID